MQRWRKRCNGQDGRRQDVNDVWWRKRCHGQDGRRHDVHDIHTWEGDGGSRDTACAYMCVHVLGGHCPSPSPSAGLSGRVRGRSRTDGPVRLRNPRKSRGLRESRKFSPRTSQGMLATLSARKSRANTHTSGSHESTHLMNSDMLGGWLGGSAPGIQRVSAAAGV